MLGLPFRVFLLPEGSRMLLMVLNNVIIEQITILFAAA